MRLPRSAIAFLLLASVCGSAQAGEVRVTPRKASPDAPPPTAFRRAEWGVDLDAKYANPFDPGEIAIDATFTGPGGRTLVVPAFWMDPGNDGAPAGFVVRFAAPAPGEWTMAVCAKDARGTSTSDAVRFTVAPGESRGFVRRSPENPRYFQFDSGEPYFMVGLNLAWANRADLKSYDAWFRNLAAAGGNFARIWMCHPNLPTETVEAGLGRYDQAACAYYDAVLDMAERNGVYCMITFNNYRDLRIEDNWGKCQWPNMPHNAANGGPATRPADYVADPRCQELYRRRLRYVAARWGAYASVAFWEFWNEQSYTNVDIPPEWTGQMAKYLKSVDAHGHLVTTSFGNAPQPAVWRMPEIDLVQEHLYPNDDATGPVSMSAVGHRAFDKPHLVAEFGISADGTDAKFDPRGVGTNLHNGLWAGMGSGSAGGACVWWWDSYVEPHDLWKTFRGAAGFTRAVDWPRRRFEPVYPPAPVLTDAPAGAETFGDAVLRAAGGWGRSHGELVEVLPNGLAYRTVPQYVYGAAHARLRTPTRIQVEVQPGGGAVVVRVAKVSEAGILRISVDGQPKMDFPFSALPGAPGQKNTEAVTPDPEQPERRIYQAVFEQDCALDLPPGRHTIELENLGGDWITLDSVTLRRVRSSRYAELRVLALYDAAAGEAVAWLHDPASNWRNDQAGVPPRTIPASTLSLPVGGGGGSTGEYDVEWWDTRAGEVTGRARARAAEGALKVLVPPVTRDVALRVKPVR